MVNGIPLPMNFMPPAKLVSVLAGEMPTPPLSRTKHVWYSEHGTYYRLEFILERVMSVTHVAVILRTRTSPAYEAEFMKMDYPDARNEYGTS